MACWQRLPVPQGEQPLAEVVPSVPRKSKVLLRMITRALLSPRYETSSAVVVGYTAAAEPPPVTPLAKPSAAPVTPAALTVLAKAARADVKRVKDLMIRKSDRGKMKQIQEKTQMKK
jgi:hypothetical protein